MSSSGFKLWAGPEGTVPFLTSRLEPCHLGSKSKVPDGSAEAGTVILGEGSLSDKLPPLPCFSVPLFFLFWGGWCCEAIQGWSQDCDLRPGQGLQGSIFMGLEICFLKAICKADEN